MMRMEMCARAGLRAPLSESHHDPSCAEVLLQSGHGRVIVEATKGGSSHRGTHDDGRSPDGRGNNGKCAPRRLGGGLRSGWRCACVRARSPHLPARLCY
jgi:hypothetical protein